MVSIYPKQYVVDFLKQQAYDRRNIENRAIEIAQIYLKEAYATEVEFKSAVVSFSYALTSVYVEYNTIDDDWGNIRFIMDLFDLSDEELIQYSREQRRIRKLDGTRQEHVDI